MKKWGSFISRIFGKRPKRLAYVLWDTGLSGGTKVLLEHVRHLNRAGIPAVAFSKKDYPTWYPYSVPFVKVSSWKELEDYDYVIASFFLAVLELWEHPFLRHKLIHFSQGFEGEYEEAHPLFDLIRRAYTLPCPLWTVGEALAEKLKRHFPHLNPYVVGQGIDLSTFFPAPTPPPAPPVKVVLIGPLEISIKRIPWGLAVLKRLKEEFQEKVAIVRISPVDTRAQEETILSADYYFTFLTPEAVAEVLRQSHILFSPSSSAEGFGLPALEAMACGVATCLSAIESYTSWDKKKDYALFFPPEDQEMAFKQLCRLVTEERERQRLRRRGLEVSQKFSFSRVINRITTWCQKH